MPLTPDQIADFTFATISNFKRNKWTDISLEHTEYISSKLIDEKKVVEQGGDQIKFDIQYKNTGTARVTGLYAQDNTSSEDVLTQGSCPWTFEDVSWSYDVREDQFQTDRETIVKLLLLKEHAALNNMAELMEQLLWTAPTSSTQAKPLGIPFWLQKDASTTPGGAFNGGNPTGYSGGAAGVSSTTYPRWKNWTFGYTNVTSDDLIKKIKKAMFNTHFTPPHASPELAFGKGDHDIFTTYTVVEQMERLAESRNDNLGKDLAKYMNMVTVGGVGVKAVPYLEANDSSQPLYGVNWKYFRPYVKSGLDMRRRKPKEAPNQHMVYNVFIDHAMQYICYNRRCQWVGSVAA
jgi:hypothetical protein